VPAVAFVRESTGLKFAHITAKVWQVQLLQKSFLTNLRKPTRDYK
jgi:hypothetical protein